MAACHHHHHYRRHRHRRRAIKVPGKKGKEEKRASEQVKAIAAEASFSVDADQGNKKSCPQL